MALPEIQKEIGVISRRDFLSGTTAAAIAAAIPTRAASQAPLLLNDASRLNPTPVFRHLVAQHDDEVRLLAALRRELKLAADEGRHVSLGCARHSMGGQSLQPASSAITFRTRRCEPDLQRRTFRARAGTRWGTVISTLDPLGVSPAVMQSNNDFGIGGTLSVNAHGWPAPYGPFGSTVREFRLMLADGTLLRCAPDENPELFGLAIGGYGLFGIVVDAEVELVENALLEPRFETMPAAEFGLRMAKSLAEDLDIRMAYGRLSIDRGRFFDEALLITYRPTDTSEDRLPPADQGGFMAEISRRIFRAQTGWNGAKRARWFMETVVGPRLPGGAATRNTLLNEPVVNLAGRDLGRTDILHEYFVPPDRFGEFLQACDEVIPTSSQDLLNVTLRYLKPDKRSVLAYAPGERIAAVMLFSQAITDDAEDDMARMTEALIDRVLAIGGSFYLPYRLHARPDQVAAAYPGVPFFTERKRFFDPKLRFRNLMWDAYFAA
jgi:FAD/FMN-containing dehydrogenase